MDDWHRNIFLGPGIVNSYLTLNWENKSVCTSEKMISDPHVTPVQVKRPSTW